MNKSKATVKFFIFAVASLSLMFYLKQDTIIMLKQISEILPELTPFQLAVLWDVCNHGILNGQTLKQAFYSCGQLSIPSIHDCEDELYFPESKIELFDLAYQAGRLLWGSNLHPLPQAQVQRPQRSPLAQAIATGLIATMLSFSLVGIAATASAVYRYSQNVSQTQ
ncbi:MAG: hypothetical protein HC862_21895 [Scytonema sp. RU_4_4]|nr:hypothetical protein [Scytonema sp. RU_4_4]